MPLYRVWIHEKLERDFWVTVEALSADDAERLAEMGEPQWLDGGEGETADRVSLYAVTTDEDETPTEEGIEQ